MPESSTMEPHSARSENASSLTGRFFALVAHPSRPRSARDHVPLCWLHCHHHFMQLVPGSLAAGVCEIRETASIEGRDKSGQVAGMNAREIADGVLCLFAAPDGKSTIAGWVLADPSGDPDAVLRGVLSNDRQATNDCSRHLHSELPCRTIARSEIQLGRVQSPHHVCDCASTPVGKPPNRRARSNSGDTCEIASASEVESGQKAAAAPVLFRAPVICLELKGTGFPCPPPARRLHTVRGLEGSPVWGVSAEGRFLREIDSDSFWFAVGNRDAPAVYAFLDPGCPHSAKAMLVLQDEIESGQIQLRVMLVSATARSSGIIAGVLGHRDPPAIFWQHMIGVGTLGKSELEQRDFESLSPAMQAAVEWEHRPAVQGADSRRSVLHFRIYARCKNVRRSSQR